MSCSIVGFGALGQALARGFARKDIDVAVASTRSPAALAPLAREIGPTIIRRSLRDALAAGIVFLAVPFWQHREVAEAVASRQGKIVIDATNAFGVPVEEPGGLPSSVVTSRALPGARLVKAFNHLPARVLAADPNVTGGRRVVFPSSDDERATAPVAVPAERPGFAPVGLGRLAHPGAGKQLGSPHLPGSRQVRIRAAGEQAGRGSLRSRPDRPPGGSSRPRARRPPQATRLFMRRNVRRRWRRPVLAEAGANQARRGAASSSGVAPRACSSSMGDVSTAGPTLPAGARPPRAGRR